MSANKKFYFSFFSLEIFIFLSCLISLARTPNTMLSRSGESQCHCLASSVRGKACSMILVIGFFPSIPSFLRVYFLKSGMDVAIISWPFG